MGRVTEIIGAMEHIQGVNDTGQPTQDGQTDVDQQVTTTSALQEDTQRRQDDGKDDLADVAVGLKVSFSRSW